MFSIVIGHLDDCPSGRLSYSVEQLIKSETQEEMKRKIMKTVEKHKQNEHGVIHLFLFCLKSANVFTTVSLTNHSLFRMSFLQVAFSVDREDYRIMTCQQIKSNNKPIQNSTWIYIFYWMGTKVLRVFKKVFRYLSLKFIEPSTCRFLPVS